MGGAAAAWVGPAAGAGDACHHLGMKALAWPLRQHTTTTAASANPAPLLHLFPFLAIISLSLSLSLSFAAAHYRLRPCRGRWLPRPLCLWPPALSVGFEEMLSQVDFALCGLGGEISTEISLKSRPNVGGLQEGFFFVDHGASKSARSAPTSISPPLPPPPPPSERGCPRREEPPAGAGSRRPNSVTVASTDGVLLLLESRLGAF